MEKWELELSQLPFNGGTSDLFKLGSPEPRSYMPLGDNCALRAVGFTMIKLGFPWQPLNVYVQMEKKATVAKVEK